MFQVKAIKIHYQLHFCSPGFFKCLHQEFIFTNTPVAITIMPLPYVLTNQVHKPPEDTD